MIKLPAIVLLSARALAACGTTEKTVIVQPAAGSTVVVPAHGGDTNVVTPAT